MKYIKTLLFLTLLGFSFSASAQCTDPDACNFNQTTVNDVCLSLETVQVHTTGALAGQTTYRLYVNFPADADYYIGAVSGSDGTGSQYQIPPLSITTTTSFYQNEFGGVTSGSINPAFYSSAPDLQYDSWVTVLGEDNTFPKAITHIADPNQPWDTEFEAGNDIIINTFTGGTWFIVGQTPQSDAPIGPSTSALIAQLTTDGDIDATVTVSYYTEASNDWTSTLSLSDACAFGECVYAEPNLNCDGTCINDTDADGICDEFEIVGCTDVTACNYSTDATDSDQSLCNFSCKGEAGATTSEGCNNEFLVNYNGHEYDLVEINGICWFAEDLRTSLYNNNAPIDEVTDAQVWSSLTPSDGGKMTYFADDAFGQAYKSYNWYAVETGLLCPTGWHVANNSDWNSLEAEAFGARGQNLSSANNLVVGNTQPLYDLGWFSQYSNGNIWDETQFSGGLRTNVDGQWKDDDGSVYWWTAEDYTGRGSNGNRKNSAWARGVKKDASWGRYKDLWSTSNSKNNALRVRCVKGGVESAPLVEAPDPFFFITPGPITDTTTVTDAQINAQDTVYIDADGTTAPAGYFFANVRGERFMTDKNGVLIPADNIKLRSGQKVFTVGDSDLIDSEIGGGAPLVTCPCCCTAGSNSYIQEFVVSTRRSCMWWCNNRAPGNCTAMLAPTGAGYGEPGSDLCWEDFRTGWYMDTSNDTWTLSEINQFNAFLETFALTTANGIAVGEVVTPVALEVNERGNTKVRDDQPNLSEFDFLKGWIFTSDSLFYRISNSWTLEGGGDAPLPEWGGAGGPEYVNVCTCFGDPPACESWHQWQFGRGRVKNCSKVCAPAGSAHPGSPPCDNPGEVAPDDEFHQISKFGPIVKFDLGRPVFRNVNDAANYGRAAGLRGIQEVVAPSIVYSEELDSLIVAKADAIGFMAGNSETVGFALGDVELEWSYDLADFAKRNTSIGQFYTSSFFYPGDQLYLNGNYDELDQVMYARQNGGLIYKVENGIVNAITDEEYNAIKSANAGLNWVDEDVIPRGGPFQRFCTCEDGGVKNCLTFIPCAVCCRVGKKYVYGIAGLYDSDDSDEFHAPTKFGYIVDFDINRPVFRNLEAAINYSKASGIKGVRPVSAPKYVYSSELDDLVLRNEDAGGFVVGDINDVGFELGNVQIEWSYDLADFPREATNTGQFYTSSFLFPGDELYLNGDLDPINQAMYVRQNGGLIFKVENNIVDAITDEEYNNIKSANAGLNWVDEDIIPSGPFGLGRWVICPPCGVRCWAPFGGWAPCRFCCGVAIAPDFSKGPDDDDDIDTPVVSKYGTLVGFNQYRPVFRSIDDAISYGTAAGLAGTHEVVAPRYAYLPRLKDYVIVDKDAVGYVAGPEGQAGFAKGRVPLEWSYDLADFARGTVATQEFYSSSFLRYGDSVYLNSAEDIDSNTFYVRQAGGLVYKVEQGVVNAITDIEYGSIKAANRDLVWDDEDFIPRGPFGRWVSCSCTNKEGDVSYGVRCWSPFGGQGVCGICCALTGGPNAP
jgi:uncharacterized protein (TIGR02145 family)